MNYHFNQLTGSRSIVEAELVKTDEHFGMSSDDVLQLQNQEEESLGVTNGTEPGKQLLVINKGL